MQRLKGKTALMVGAGSIGPGWGNGKATAFTSDVSSLLSDRATLLRGE